MKYTSLVITTLKLKWILYIILFIVSLSKSYPSELFIEDYKIKQTVYSSVIELINYKELSENDIVRVLGYYDLNDGGYAEYIIKKLNPNEISSGEYFIELSNDFKAFLIEPKTVNYKMFGAKGDGINNDAIQISKAHQYANSKDIPIVNYKGEYWLKEIDKIIIQTNVDWGNTIFHIDEKYNKRTDYRFEVTSKNKSFNIHLSSDQKKELLNTLKPGETGIAYLFETKN